MAAWDSLLGYVGCRVRGSVWPWWWWMWVAVGIGFWVLVVVDCFDCTIVPICGLIFFFFFLLVACFLVEL